MEPNVVGAPPQTVENQQASEHDYHHHRRAFSDNLLGVDNDISYKDMLVLQHYDFDIADFQLPPPPATDEMGFGWIPVPVGSDHVDGIGMAVAGRNGGEGKGVERRHRHSYSIDGSSTVSSSVSKKAMAPEKLAELAKTDPKRAKRIISNRLSAARSKERKMRYALELEKRVQSLRIEAATLSTQLATLKKDTGDLAIRNKELKTNIQVINQEAQIRSALNQSLREEVHSLKTQISQLAAITGNISFGGMLSQQFSSQLTLQQFTNPQTQLHAHQQPQLCMPPPSKLEAFQQPQLCMPPPSQLHSSQQPQLCMPPPSQLQASQQAQLCMPPPPPAAADADAVPFGQPFSGHFIGSKFLNYNQLN